MNRFIQSKSSPLSRSLLVILGIMSLALASARAVTPAPDGGYANGNTAEGTNALFSLTSGAWNTAIGLETLFKDTSGGSNTAVGVRALNSNTTGGNNTAIGVYALKNNTFGLQNTAIGFQALSGNIGGSYNTATGYQALSASGESNFNTAYGYQALMKNTNGSDNNAVGYQALGENTMGNGNTAVGDSALFSNQSGGSNAAFGTLALNATTGDNNTAVGYGAGDLITTGSDNTVIGFLAARNIRVANNVIAIGDDAADVSNTCWIGNIYGVTTQSAVTLPVIVSNGGQLGTAASSARFKKDIRPMERTSDAILALKPVTFHYKNDNTSTPQFGLVAEDVATVDPDLVVRDDKGDVYTVRYDAVNVMLLNEFLKEHQQVQRQQKEIDALRAELKEQRTLIRKVSAQLEAKRSTPQLAVNE